MELGTIGLIVGIIVELGTIAGFVFALGKRDARLESLEKAFDKEQEKNSSQHKDFYATRDTVTSISVTITELTRRIGNIEEDLKEVLRRLPGGDN